ncbi:MAG: iron-sulfur cluster repair di-iron protein [Armatimonadetes bacterium]|nr:iron-sulfur cluster repair di-iron protein [Armatimonadota bacterium]
MLTMDTGTTVGEMVAVRPSRAKVFERFGIDYCCGGKQPLGQACADKSLDPEAVLAALEAHDATPRGEDDRDWTQATLTELADHIEATHHQFLREALPRLAQLTAKIAQVHGERHPELREVSRIFLGLRSELEMHMMKEEEILFPLCRQLESAAGPTAFHCGSIGNPIRVMEFEHDNAGQALAALARLTGGYQAPEDGCNTYRATLDGLRELEDDLHAHIHKENSILFPRALAVEAEQGR